MTKQEAVNWLRVYGDLPDELRAKCQHGHAECSTTDKGECLDDVIRAAVNPPEATI